jgi:hypothetical protein
VINERKKTMKTMLWAMLTGWMLTGWISANAAGQAEVRSQIESVSLFKNGLAVVRRTLELPGSGSYLVHDVPTPVHGTFWVESDANLRVRVVQREVEGANDAAGRDLRRELAGAEVELLLHDREEPLHGRLLPAPETAATWNRSHDIPRHGYLDPHSRATTATPGRFVVLQTAQGITYVDQGQIRQVMVRGALPTVKTRQPMLLLENEREGQTQVTLSYLTRGLAWAPSYRVELDGERLRLTQQAVIRNELTALNGALVRLISGFPHIKFSQVESPLAAEQNWARFFQQLQAAASGGATPHAMTQQPLAVTYNVAMLAPDFPLPEGEAGADIHYQDIGALRLDEGESVALTTADGESAMKRIVEWTIADPRGWDGSYVSRGRDADKEENDAWDAVHFTNPLGFPMTTAPAAIFEDGRFRGQTQSFWINPGQRGMLRITKALSIVTRATEREIQDEGGRRDSDYVFIGGRRFRRAVVTGKLVVNNHRGQSVNLLIRRQFSGDLLEAAGEPRNDLRPEGVSSINPRHELTWEKTLGAGAQLELDYRYSVLIAH